MRKTKWREPEVRWLFATATTAVTALVVSACSSGNNGHAPPKVMTTPDASAAASYTIDVSATDDSITVKRNGDALVRFPVDGLELGRVTTVADDANYDPVAFEGKATGAPADLEWLQVQSIAVTMQSAEGVMATLTYGPDVSATLTVNEPDAGRFDATLVPTSGADRIAYYRLRARTDPTEGFYGLGEYFDSVNNRGKVRAMQLELDTTVESSYNDAHVPVPFVTGTRGWGLFVESRYPMAFDLGSQEPDLVEVTVATGLKSSQGLSFHVFAAETALDVTKHYYDVTGYPIKPARWATGPIVWRNQDDNQTEVESDLTTIRTLDLATTALWIDRPYATAVQTFDFDPSIYTDPAGMIQHAHDLGFRMALWHAPYLDQKSAAGMAATAALQTEATTKGYFPPTQAILFNSWGPPIDFTNADASAWWQTLLQKYTSLGIEGFKLDYGEDVVLGIAGSLRTKWQFSDGTDERTMHAGYASVYHQTYAKTLPDSGGFLLCRAGTYGDQTHVSVIWPGDLDATFAKRGDPGTDGTSAYTSAGGLPASVIAGLSLSASGFPLFGADTGGYRHAPPDQETFMRWFEQTALSTVMEIGTASNTVAWELQQNGFDQSELDAYKKYTRLHLRLFPYEWTYIERLQKDGRAIVRPLGLAYPELGEHPDDIYLFGDDLLVAPVVTKGAVNRDVSFPTGTWVDWWTGETHAGGQHATVAAPIDVLPLFVRKSAIVPMLRPTIDAIAATTEPNQVDSYATTPGIVYARIVPGPKSDFALYDGASLSQEMTSKGLTLSSSDGTEFKQGVVFEVVTWSAKPAAVSDGSATLGQVADLTTLEAAASGWAYDPASTGGTLYVKVAAGKHAIVVTK